MIKVQYIDNDAFLAKRIQNELTRLKFQVDISASGAETLSRFKEDKPDILIINLQLQDMDGEDLLVEIRKLNKDIKILMMTRIAPETEEILFNIQMLALKEKGASGLLLKPFAVEKLIQKIHEHVQP